jgi:ethanolamine transporter EutH
MSTWRRIGVALFTTIGLMIAGLLYNEVFVQELLPLVDSDGMFSTPVMWLENLVPIVIVAILLATWAWVIAGAVQDEKTVDRRRVR